MEKDILVGSIFAIAILIILSFTSVVAFQTIKSNSAINSPLFIVRTDRAVDKESMDFACDYIGMEKGNDIFFPNRNVESTAILKAIDRFKSMMDDKTFNRFIGLTINSFKKGNNINPVTINEIITFFELLRNDQIGPENFKIIQKSDSDNGYATEVPLATVNDPQCLTINNPFRCFVVWLFLIIIDLRLKLTALFGCSV